jgi:MHS family proline/betaine transporter-like MFS transporter
MGRISNRFSPRKFTIIFAYLIILLLIPAFLAVNSANYFIFLLGLSCIPILAAGLCAPAYPYAIQKFKAEMRYSGVGVSYTLGIAIFGGFSPVVCSYLMKTTMLSYSPAFYVIGLAFLYVIFENILGKSKSEPL